MVTSPENPIDPRDNEQPDETAPMPTDTEPTIQSESASDPLDLFGSSERMATEPMPEHMAAEQTTTGQTEPMTTPTAATDRKSVV